VRAPRGARVAVAAAFAVNGVAGGNWVVRIPEIQDRLDLSDATLGLALLGMPLGAIVVMPFAGSWAARFGSRVIVRIGTFGICAGVMLPGLAPSLLGLALALVLYGMANGVQDVSMNAHGVAVEKRYGRTIMSSFHAFFSVGAMVGAIIGGLVAQAGVSTRVHLIAVGLVLAVVTAVVMRHLLPAEVDASQSATREPVFTRIPRAVLGLGIIGFCALLAEGAMADWSAVYLRNTLETGPGLAAAGYAVFSLAMTVGRLAGDRLTDNLGPVRIIETGGILAAVGVGLALLLANPYVALIGFGLTGLGLSIIVPVVFSSAGRSSVIAPSRAISAVTTTGYFGFMAGPPLIGFIAHVVTLRGALVVVVALSLVMVGMAGAVGRGTRDAGRGVGG
jgi:MFS family permease